MSKEFSIEQMQALMRSVAENQIGELLFETEGVRLRIRGKQAAPTADTAPAVSTAAGKKGQEPAQAAPPAAVASKSRTIKSPLVGTFYASGDPDKPPFAAVGQTVQEGDIVFIVESMKVMNEISADQSGVVAELLVESGAPVEYGQPILRLE